MEKKALQAVRYIKFNFILDLNLKLFLKVFFAMIMFPLKVLLAANRVHIIFDLNQRKRASDFSSHQRLRDSQHIWFLKSS